ncbi:MAG: CPXCG motif-containing cysteine-rich protein [Pseudomonadales bacterium]
MQLLEQRTQCPYCGETITVLVDDSVEQQEYIEDCQVCCRPIELTVSVDGFGHASVWVTTDSE